VTTLHICIIEASCFRLGCAGPELVELSKGRLCLRCSDFQCVERVPICLKEMPEVAELKHILELVLPEAALLLLCLQLFEFCLFAAPLPSWFRWLGFAVYRGILLCGWS